MRASTISLFIAGLIAPFALAAPAERANQVLTPNGLRDASKVHHVPQGAKVSRVGDEVHIIAADGKVLHKAKADSAKVRPTKKSVEKRFGSGWIAYAGWSNGGDPINQFTTDWTVPATPANSDGQTVFLFNSIEPSAGNAIIQPVLQWGGSAAGGGAYWAVASWYVDGSNSYYSSLVNVNVGDSLTGVITLTNVNGDTYSYNSQFTNVAGTSLDHDGEVLTWATETLEVYSVQNAGDLPAGSTTFSNINIGTTTGTPSVTWSPTSDDADGVTTSIDVDGATGAQITIHY